MMLQDTNKITQIVHNNFLDENRPVEYPVLSKHIQTNPSLDGVETGKIEEQAGQSSSNMSSSCSPSDNSLKNSNL